MKRILPHIVFVVLASLLAVLPLQAVAVTASGLGYSLTPTLLSLPHRGSGTLTTTLTMPANTVGSISASITTSEHLGFSNINNHSGGIGLGVGLPQPNEFIFSVTDPYIMLDSAQGPQQINWSITSVLDGVTNQDSGSFTISVEHDYGDPVVTPPTCTEDGYTTHTCEVCGYSYTSDGTPALGHDFLRAAARDKAATCTSTGVEAWTCSRCGEKNDKEIPALGHSPGEWEVTVQPTNKKTGTQVKKCTRCGIILETMEIPMLSKIWPNNTACSYGPRFRDELPGLTDKWYMYTPLDLTKEGTLDVPLIASNRYRIGTAQVIVKDGQVTANYQVTAHKVEVKEEFMAFLPGLEGLVSAEPEALADSAVPFGTPVDIASLGGGGQALFFMRLVVTYDIYADGVQWWSMR